MAGEMMQAGGLIVASVLAAYEEAATQIMEEADVLVPKDTETLRESARINPPNTDPMGAGVTFGFGFGGAINPKTGNAVNTYAVPVHERTEVFHEPPTQAKYLEEPLLAYAAMMEHDIGAKVQAMTFTPEPRSSLFGGGVALRGPGGRFIKRDLAEFLLS